MADQETVITKKRGPKPTGKGELIGVRLLPDLLKPLDKWIDEQPEPKPSRPEAIRRLLRKALGLA
jgi:metal-responsive CopG/Arc/MetJ family transcriptional regulator